MTTTPESRLRMLNRDWDRINHARQKERDATPKEGTSDARLSPGNPHETPTEGAKS